MRSIPGTSFRGFIETPSTLRQHQLVRSNKLLRWWRHPAARVPGLDVQNVHGVDLFEGFALTLAKEEVDDEDGRQIAAGEDVTVGEVDVTGDEGGEEGQQEVPDPVRGSCHGHAGCAVTGWVHW